MSEFYMAWRKKFTKIFTYGRDGRLSTPCLNGVDFAHAQTVKKILKRFLESDNGRANNYDDGYFNDRNDRK